ncbi:MAG: ketoacyl-ACP synthase III [Moraxellaceae bacterium]|nr:ketoacyl-ACP synthase III [Moraxellaceae bacterium]
MAKYAFIAAIEYVLPEQQLTNQDLAAEFAGWGVDKIFQKTGIATRHIAAKDECASDLAVAAAQRLFEQAAIAPSQIDYIIYCTQSPDYVLPATSCVIQNRLGIPVHCGAIDVNQGCSGFVYSLGLAKALVESGQATNVLVLTAETYSKYINPRDKSVRTLFGDAATATLVSVCESDKPFLHSFYYGSDGSGAPNLIVPAGGSRQPLGLKSYVESEDDSGNFRSDADLYMNGAEVFAFTLKSVPSLVSEVLSRSGLQLEDVDYFVPHQANKFMLDAITKRIGIPDSKTVRAYESCGNTVSCTIPIALVTARQEGHFAAGNKLLLAGFGVGYSWAGCIVEWR